MRENMHNLINRPTIAALALWMLLSPFLFFDLAGMVKQSAETWAQIIAMNNCVANTTSEGSARICVRTMENATPLNALQGVEDNFRFTWQTSLSVLRKATPAYFAAAAIVSLPLGILAALLFHFVFFPLLRYGTSRPEGHPQK